jgi:predicted metalloendopeptidase
MMRLPSRAACLVSTAVAALVAATSAQPAPISGLDVASFDRSVRPQDDLYRHVNGGWLDRTPMPPERVSFSASTELVERVDVDLRVLIEELAAQPHRDSGSPAQQIGDFYASMMNQERVEALGLAPIERQLTGIRKIETASQFAAAAGALAAIGAAGAFGAAVSLDPMDNTQPMVHLSQGGILLPDADYYLQDTPRYAEIRRLYQQYLERILTLAHWDNAAEDAAAVLALETALARAHERRDADATSQLARQRYLLADLSRRMPGFDWMAWARPQRIDLVPTVVLVQPAFFQQFAALVPATPISTWRAWLAARYLTASAPFIGRDFTEARFDFFGRTLSGQQEPREFWRRGVSLVSQYLGEAIGKLYVERHFPESAKRRVERMVSLLIRAYRQAVLEMQWMSPQTKTEALNKLARMSSKIGYPDRWRAYRGLVIRADDLLGNIERAKQFENDFRMRWLGRPVDNAGWLMTPQTVNAYYSPGMNEIVFPAAILQPPYFNAAADDAVNFGAIGAVIGHEIGHAILDSGRQYDSIGRLRDWWMPADDREYARRASVLVQQFNEYSPLPGFTINGSLTLGENLGDLAGLSIAYRAYKMSLDGDAAPVIDGLTGDQRFFMGWVQIWREQIRDEYLRQLLVTATHPPGRYRANGPVSSVPAFYEAFGVKPGDGLFRTPEQRVRIW